MRTVLKALAEGVVGNALSCEAVCRVTRPRVILAYHNVVPDEGELAGDRSLHMPVAQFRAQMTWLKDAVAVRDLESLLSTGTSDRLAAVSITFDDAYEGAVTVGLPVLAELDLPATMFVCTGWRGGEVPWWDATAGAGGLDEARRDRELWDASGRSCEVVHPGSGPVDGRSVPPHLRISSADTLERYLDGSRVRIGSHSVDHPNLAALDPPDLFYQLSESRETLFSRWKDRAIDFLAYPYGISNEAVERAAMEAGYSGALLVAGGRLPRTGWDPFAIPRINVPARLSLAGLRLRVMGVLS